MPEQNLLLGWTCDMWLRAEAYYNLRNPDAPVNLPNFYITCMEILKTRTGGKVPDLSTYCDVQEYWHRHRPDEPTNSDILIAEMYRARPKDAGRP